MKRSLALAASVVALVLLVGCASETTVETITITPGQTGMFTSGDSTIVVGGDATDAPRDEAAYLSIARDEAPEGSVVETASDADLLAAGQAACDQLAQDVDDEKISVTVAGKALAAGGDDVFAIVDAASLSLCA